MESLSFKKIRENYPKEFLVLVDYDEHVIKEDEVQITGAKFCHAYNNGDDMLEAYRVLKKKGEKVIFCTPYYQDNFIIERRIWRH